MTRRNTRIATLVLLLLSAAIILCSLPAIATAFENVAYAAEGIAIHYFNDDVQDDDIGTNNYNFGPDRKAPADQAVKDGTAKSVQEYIATNEGKGDFFDSIAIDPALCAAIAVDMDERLAFPEPILVDEQNELIGQRADKAHLHFLDDHEYWQKAVAEIKARLTSGQISIKKIDSYTSSMYQWHDHLEGNKPAVIVRSTTHSGGYFVEFDLGKPGVVKYRLECGYQPINVDYWPIPDNPPVPDNPDPKPDPKPDPDPDPTPDPTPDPKPDPKPDPDPDPTPDPKPDPDPDPTPTPQPKNPNAGPNAQIKDDKAKADFGGGKNKDVDKTVTDEPKSPEKYTPPAPPKADDSGKKDDSKDKTDEPKTSDSYKQPKKPSGSDIVDKVADTIEKIGDIDFHVIAGDGEQHTDLGKIQEEQSHDTVEESLKEEDTNLGDILPPE